MNPEGGGGEQAVARPWEEDSHKVTRQSPVDMAQEIVRECLLDRLHQVGGWGGGVGETAVWFCGRHLCIHTFVYTLVCIHTCVHTRVYIHVCGDGGA